MLLSGALLAGCEAEPECVLCVEPDPILVGASLPLSGPLSRFGQAQRTGIEQVATRINDAGGLDVGGERRQVELVVLDNRGNPDVAGQGALVLIRSRRPVVALLGACAPPLTLIRVAEARQVSLVSACGPLPGAVGSAPTHSWQVGATGAERAPSVVAALGPPRGRQVAVFVSPGRSADPFVRAAADAGFAVIGSWSRGPAGRDGMAGWRGPVSEAGVDRVDVVLADTDPPDGLALWRQLRISGVSPGAAWVRDAGLSSAWIDSAGRSAEGTLTDAVRPAATGDPDEAVVAASAAATEVLLDAVSRSGSGRRSDVNDALATGSAVLVGAPPGAAPHVVVRWQDGRLVPL